MYFLYFSFFSDIFIWILPKAHKILNTLLWLLHERRKESNWEIISFQFVIIEQEREIEKKDSGAEEEQEKKIFCTYVFLSYDVQSKMKKKKARIFNFSI